MSKPNTGATVESMLNPFYMVSDDYKAFAPAFKPSRYQKAKERIVQLFIVNLGIPVDTAKLLADAAADDAHAVLSKVNADFKVGKASKDGTITMSEVAAKVKGVYLTRPLALVKATQYIEEASNNGINFGHTGWVLTPDLQEYVNNVIVTGEVNPDKESTKTAATRSATAQPA